MSDTLSASAQRVQDALTSLGLACRVVETGQSARTAGEAASAVGCRVEQIVKSLVFKRKSSGKPVLVVASGSNRVNERKLAALVAEPTERADADFVRRETGYAIGGVPPIGHVAAIETYVDEDLLQYQEIWAAAGTPNAVFSLSPSDLVRITAGRVVCIK